MASHDEIFRLDDYPIGHESTSNNKQHAQAKQDDLDLARYGKKQQLRVSCQKTIHKSSAKQQSILAKL